ncbi:MAG: hypothetical protein AABZ62_08000 [Planctomycetota bacterium]
MAGGPHTGSERHRIMTVVKGEALRSRDLYERPPKYELFFPNFVMKELCVGLFFLIILFIWSYFKNAPLYELADPTKTPAHIKAAWYFVGLQELLAYFDPYMAGVIMPTAILAGLYLAPFLDPDPIKGIGRFAWKERRFAMYSFIGGFVFWWLLIVIGWYLRGPLWAFYWPWEDHHIIKPPPPPPWSFPLPAGIAYIIVFFGLGITVPGVIFPNFFYRMGVVRYGITMFLWTFMIFALVKMFLNNAFNIKYILVTPWFNI